MYKRQLHKAGQAVQPVVDAQRLARQRAQHQADDEQQLETYADFCENELNIPVLKGKKTDKEKFAGAEATYTIEAMMHDGLSLIHI